MCAPPSHASHLCDGAWWRRYEGAATGPAIAPAFEGGVHVLGGDERDTSLDVAMTPKELAAAAALARAQERERAAQQRAQLHATEGGQAAGTAPIGDAVGAGAGAGAGSGSEAGPRTHDASKQTPSAPAPDVDVKR